MPGLTYAGTGVDYAVMDPFKVLAQEAGFGTSHNLLKHGFREVPGIRGESAYLIECPSYFLAHVEEGLGTKNLVADALADLDGIPDYGDIAQDTVAMIVNDMVTVGAQPLSVAMHLAVGSGDWFKWEQRTHDLVKGWALACNLAGCAWGGGETPTLRNIVYPDAAVLSGSAIGIVKPKRKLIRGDIRKGDLIVLLASNGIHANSLTLCRDIANILPESYRTKLPSGRTYGHVLLYPTHIYVGIIQDCLEGGIVTYPINIRYAINITGHGWRKLMRHPKSFAYVIEKIVDPMPEIFPFIQTHGKMNDKEMWGNFNMGAGFAVMVRPRDADTVIEWADAHDIKAWVGGHVEPSAEKKVVIEPMGLEFTASSFQIR